MLVVESSMFPASVISSSTFYTKDTVVQQTQLVTNSLQQLSHSGLMTLVDLLSSGTFCNMMWSSKWRMENLKRSPTFQHQLNGMLGVLSVTGIQNLQRFGQIISSQLFQNMPFMCQWEDSSLAVSVKYRVPHLCHQQEKVHEIILLPNSVRVQHYGALIYGKENRLQKVDLVLVLSQ